MFGHWCQSRKGLGVCNVDNRLIPLKRKNRCSQPKKLLRCWEIRVAASCAYWVIGFFRRVDLGNLWINYINWTMFLLDLWRVTVSSLKQSSFWILLPLVKSSCNWHSPRSALQKHLQFFWNIQASWREGKKANRAKSMELIRFGFKFRRMWPTFLTPLPEHSLICN